MNNNNEINNTNTKQSTYDTTPGRAFERDATSGARTFNRDRPNRREFIPGFNKSTDASSESTRDESTPRKEFTPGDRPVNGRRFAPRGDRPSFGPRPEGSFGPRREGGFAPRGPRPEGSFGPRREGGFAPRGPRPEGSFGPRREGGFAPRSNFRPQGSFKSRDETSRTFTPRKSFQPTDAPADRPEGISLYSNKKPMERRIHGDKKTLSTRKFNYTCFIKDENDKYVMDNQYTGDFGSVKKYTAHNVTNRNRTTISNKGLYKGSPVKELTLRLPGSDGRNNNGHITSAHRFTPTRRIYRKIDFFRDGTANATVLRLEKDPNRNAFIALVKDEDTRIYYIPATINMRVGDVIQSGPQADCLAGNVLTLENIDNESFINNIEVIPGSGAKLVRAAGTYATLVRKEGGYAFVRLPSGEERKFLLACKACVGQMSNPNYDRQKIGSAGKAFYRGRRPVNRPICRNPVDHPMGGRTSGGKVFRNKNGKLIKGQRTRGPRKSNKLIYASRHKRAK